MRLLTILLLTLLVLNSCSDKKETQVKTQKTSSKSSSVAAVKQDSFEDLKEKKTEDSGCSDKEEDLTKKGAFKLQGGNSGCDKDD